MQKKKAYRCHRYKQVAAILLECVGRLLHVMDRNNPEPAARMTPAAAAAAIWLL